MKITYDEHADTYKISQISSEDFLAIHRALVITERSDSNNLTLSKMRIGDLKPEVIEKYMRKGQALLEVFRNVIINRAGHIPNEEPPAV